MTDDSVGASTEAEAPAEASAESSAEPAESKQTTDHIDVSTVVRYLQWGGLLGLGLLAAVATVGLYTSFSSIIDIWVGQRFQPLARAGFNLAVLCVTLAGLFGLSRRL